MAYQITSGKIQKPQKVLIYGTEGVGKTTLAAQFPSPLFIDIEGGTTHIDVNRLPQPTSWSMLIDEVKWIRDFPEQCGGTLVIDTLDWAQTLCAEHICHRDQVKSIEDYGYGAGYNKMYEEFGKLINLLSDVNSKGLNILCLAHAYVGRREIPSETGLYDCWTTKLDTGKRSNISAMVREWADAVLFCDFKTIVTVVNEKSGKAKAQGGERRIIHTQHSAAWDAKNRWGLPPEIDMKWEKLSPHIPVPAFSSSPVPKVPLADEPVVTLPEAEPIQQKKASANPQPSEIPDSAVPFDVTESYSAELDKLAGQIRDFGLTEAAVMKALCLKGYFPEGTDFSVLEKREDLLNWIPTVLPQMKDFAQQNKLI